MKAAQYSKYGGTEVIEINETETPRLTPDQILVEIHAASINPIDFKVREGYIPGIPSSFPATIGGDFSGIVKEVGEGVENLKPGNEVFGQAGILNGGTGSMAEFALANPTKIAAKPANTTFEEAASLPLAGVSALQAIEDHIQIKPGQKILINGGAGGIGSFAIQIAKANGAQVATSVSGDDVEFVKSLGADKIIDYKKQNFADELRDYDAVFDTAGPLTWDASIKILKKGGVIVSMNGQPNPELAKENGVTSIGQSTDATPERLKRLKQLVESGKVRPNIDRVFSLEETKLAFEYQESYSPRGKVVIKVS